MTIYHHTARGSITGEQWTFNLHTSSSSVALADAASAWDSAVSLLWLGTATPTDSIKQLIPTTASLLETITASLSPSTGKQVGAVNVPNVKAGTNANGMLPPQCSVVVSHRTAVRNRSGRGRFYLPVYAVNECVLGLLDSTAQTQTKNACKGMFDSLIGAGLTPVVFHRKTLTTDNITTFDIGNVFDTQRRRRDKLIETRVSSAV